MALDLGIQSHRPIPKAIAPKLNSPTLSKIGFNRDGRSMSGVSRSAAGISSSGCTESFAGFPGRPPLFKNRLLHCKSIPNLAEF
jgi:hypothetical protein